MILEREALEMTGWSNFLNWQDAWKVTSLGKLYLTISEVRDPFFFFYHILLHDLVLIYLVEPKFTEVCRYFVNCHWFPRGVLNIVFLEPSTLAAFQGPPRVYFLKMFVYNWDKQYKIFFLYMSSIKVCNCYSHNTV